MPQPSTIAQPTSDSIRDMTSLIHADEAGFFGNHGGRFLPPQLEAPIAEVAAAYAQARQDPDFQADYEALLADYVGRPSPLFLAAGLTRHLGGAKIYLKREDLNHTGAHKINHCLGEGLLAKRMGKKKLIAETGAGQHGVATATVAALFGMECHIFMGELDVERQRLNVFRMRLLGATVIPVSSGTGTLKDATSEAIRYWATNITDTYYVIGSAVGPHPYPEMVRDFQKVIGEEIRVQSAKAFDGKPDYLVACIGGGSNAIGIFSAFLGDADVNLIGVEAAGLGAHTPYHAATLTKGRTGIIHGMKTIVLQDEYGMIEPVHSISAGLDYPGVGPEHAHLHESKRAAYYGVTDDECINALYLTSRLEGIIPAIESSHALAYLEKLCPNLTKKSVIVVNVSGRGDKDINTVMSYEKGKIYG